MSDQVRQAGKTFVEVYFEILERVGTVAYRLALPLSLLSVHEVFHVSMLRKYTLDPTHVVDWGELIIDTDGVALRFPRLGGQRGCETILGLFTWFFRYWWAQVL